MNDAVRTLLYPLGFISSFFFAMRFFIQWYLSEKARRSQVTPMFWTFSILGSVLLMIHSFIQVQYHIMIIQTFNALLSWRNINLTKSSPITLSSFLMLCTITLAVFTALFIWQSLICYHSIYWTHTPFTPFKGWGEGELSPLWHIIGSLGILLFALRFWLQWIQAEKKQTCQLQASFWWLSICGALLAVTYFVLLGDVVNITGYGLGMIPYVRNLVLLKKYG